MEDNIQQDDIQDGSNDLVILGGEAYKVYNRKAFVSFRQLKGISLENLPIGIELMSSEYDFNFEDYGYNLETGNIGISRENNGMFRIQLFTRYRRTQSLEIQISEFINLKRKEVLSLTASNPRIEEFNSNNLILNYSIEVAPGTCDEIFMYGMTANEQINNKIMDAIKLLPQQIRTSLGLNNAAMSTQIQTSYNQGNVSSLLASKSSFEIYAAGIDYGNPDSHLAVVSVEYPTENWSLEMKVEWFMLLKAELLLKRSLFSPVIIKNDLMSRVLVYSLKPSVGTDVEIIQYAKTLNDSINSELIQESEKIQIYIESDLGLIKC